MSTNEENVPEEVLQGEIERLRPIVEAAVTFSQDWNPELQPTILAAALRWLAGEVDADGLLETRSQLPRPPHVDAGGDRVNTGMTPIDRLAAALDLESDHVRRCVEIDGDGSVRILGRIEGKSVRERQNKYGVVYAFVKEKALGEMQVDVEALRSICERHGCYDSANFTANFRRDGRLREIKGGSGQGRRYVPSKVALEQAAEILQRMATT